jgi:hypothetical protein
MWIAIALVSGLASLAGYGLFQDASPETVGFGLTFAAGAILTMLANTRYWNSSRRTRPMTRRRSSDDRLRDFHWIWRNTAIRAGSRRLRRRWTGSMRVPP